MIRPPTIAECLKRIADEMDAMREARAVDVDRLKAITDASAVIVASRPIVSPGVCPLYGRVG